MKRRSTIQFTIGLMILVLGLAVSVGRADPVSGVVVRSGDSAPIPGARVALQPAQGFVLTLPDGSFTLNVPAGPGKTIVGAAKGYFNAGVAVTSPSSGVQIVLTPVPQDDNAAYQFVTPQTCGVCHPNQVSEWTNTPMSRAGLNTWVHDIYNGQGTPHGMGGFVYTRDSIFAPTNPNSECAACHQPESWIPAPFSRMQGPQDAGYPSVAASHGISCDVCHKVADVDVSKINFPGIFPGAVTFTRPTGATPNQVQYGVLGDTTVNFPTLMRSSYQPQLRAEVCGTCHQDRSDPEENHSYTGPISEPTYIEWLESPYADPQSPLHADCVSCHMPASGQSTFCTVQVPPIPRDPSRIGSHNIRGTTTEFLQNAVDLLMQTQVSGSTLQVNVTLANNNTGHHVPTGVTTRNMILLVEAWPDGGDPIADILPYSGTQTVHPLGGVGNPAQGYYAGRPGKLYAKVNHDALNNSTTFFTDATGIVFDTRIPALQSDNTAYAFTLPPTATNVHVRARVLYRRAWRALVDAKQWTQDGHGNPLGDVQAPNYGYLMESSEMVIPSCPTPGNGDVNGDGLVNGQDIAGFVAVYLNNPTGPASGAFCAANMQPDGAIDSLDLTLFIARLISP